MKEQKVATKEIIRIEKMHRFIGPRRERVRNLKSLKQAFAVVLPERRYKPENIRPVRRMSFSSAGSLPTHWRSVYTTLNEGNCLKRCWRINYFMASASERSFLAVGIGYSSPVFICSNVSNSGTRSITSLAAPFNPVPSV